jgi:hypothetical protein
MICLVALTLKIKNMYSLKSYRLTKEEFNYLLAVLRSKLFNRGDRYYFNGSSDDLTDMLNILKGLYNNYDDLKNMVSYKCFIQCSINPFRSSINVDVI